MAFDPLQAPPDSTAPSTEATKTVAALRATRVGTQTMFDQVALTGRLAGGRRIASVDMLRGVAAVLMVLDHALFYFGNAPAPDDWVAVSAALFFTHWITQFAAPVFVLLAGLGAYLRIAKGYSRRLVSDFLATRGLMLILFDVTLVPALIWFNFDARHFWTGDLWTIGWAMLALAALVYLRVGVVAVIGMTIVVLHNALDGIQAHQLGALDGLWRMLHEPGTVQLGGDFSLRIDQPLIPWIGVVACGYSLGELYCLADHLRRAMLFGLGANLLVSFFILRGLNVYGDPMPWTTHDDWFRTVLSFLNCTAKPASFSFLLMTLGPILMLLAWFEPKVTRLRQRLAVFGSVPLYVYIVHWPLLHLLAIGVCWLRDQPLNWLFNLPDPATGRGAGWQPQFGVELPTVYLMWAIALVVLYAGCQRYAQLKFTYRPRWASYF